MSNTGTKPGADTDVPGSEGTGGIGAGAGRGGPGAAAREAGAPPLRYRVEVMHGARPGPKGVSYQRDAFPQLLEWRRVARAFAAEVGEPEGVRTIVFDLVVWSDGRGASSIEAYRLDADPTEDAVGVARAIADALPPERLAPSLKSLATEGTPTRWYPDLGGFEEAILETLGGA